MGVLCFATWCVAIAICRTVLCLPLIGSKEGKNMDAHLQDCIIEEQRGVVRFLWAEGVKPVEIHRRNGSVVFCDMVRGYCHLQNSALPSVDWQQGGQKHGCSFARLHHRRTTWRSAVSLGRRSETCGNSPS